MTQTAGESARSAKEEIKQQAGEAGRQLREQASATGQQLKQQAFETADKMKEQGRTMAAERKDQVADQISGVSAAIRDAAHRLHDEEDHNIARYTEALADQVDKVSGYLRNRDLGGLMRDCENAVRRRPEVFIGGMFVTGLAMARFLKASRRRSHHHDEFDRDFTTSRAYPETTDTTTGREDAWSESDISHRPYETASTGSLSGAVPASAGAEASENKTNSGLAGASVTSAGYGASSIPDIPEPRSQSNITNKPR